MQYLLLVQVIPISKNSVALSNWVWLFILFRIVNVSIYQLLSCISVKLGGILVAKGFNLIVYDFVVFNVAPPSKKLTHLSISHLLT